MNKQTALQEANYYTQKAIKMYEECERCRKLAMNKYNWRYSQTNWKFADAYRELANAYNSSAQLYYKMVTNS